MDKGILDKFTIIDELLVENTRAMNRNLEALGQLTNIVRESVPEHQVGLSSLEFKQRLLTGQITYYDKPLEFDMATARTNHEMTLEGNQIFALTDAESLDGVGIRLNRMDASLIYFTESNPIGGQFYKVFLTHPALTGTLKVFVSRGAIFRPVIRSTKPTLAPNQKKFSLLVTRRATDGNPLTGNSAVIVTAYTVPAGWNLHLSSSIATCNISCIQEIALARAAGIIGDYHYDMRGELLFGSLSSTMLGPGDVLTITIYNNHDDFADFAVNVNGVLEALEV